MDLKLKQESLSLAQAGIGLVFLVLVLAGIGGTIYKVIAPDGWIAMAFGRSFSAGVAALGSLGLVLGLAWFSRGWTSSHRTRNRTADLIVGAFAIAGFVYLAHFWFEGSF